MTVKREQWPGYAVGAVSLVFIILKGWFLAPRFSDGAIYAYLGQRVMDGAIPYVDFFYSSPPLLPYIFGLFGLIFGWQWWSWAWLPIALSVFDAGVLYWLGRHFWSRWAGLMAAVSYLFSFVVVATTDFTTDVHFVVTLALVAALLLSRERSWQAGILLAAALLIKVYAVVLIVPLVGWFLWQRRWRGVAVLGVSFACVVLVVGLILQWLTDGAWYTAVVTNNLGRGVGVAKDRLLPFIFWHDWWLLLGVLMPLAVRRWVPAVLVLTVGAGAVFLLCYPDVYYLYFKLLAPWLALLLGWGSWYLYEEYGRVAAIVLLGIVLASSLLTGVRYVREQARAAVITPLRGLVEYIEDTTSPTDALYGNFEVTPLVALASERRIFGDIADTNVKFYLNGTVNIEERIEELVAARVPVLITKAITDGKSVLGGYEDIIPAAFVNEYCRVGKIFSVDRDYTDNAVVVWRCSY